MILTLREAMKRTPLNQAKVVAGESGMDRIISSVNIIEVPEVSQWMKGGELLFSTGYAFGGDSSNGCNMLTDLNAIGITALAIKPGKYLQTIPEDMIAHAQKLGFPLLELPYDQPYSNFMEPIYEILIDEKAALLQKVSNFHQSLLQAMMMGGLEKILEVFSSLIQKPVFLLDRNGEIMIRPQPMTLKPGTWNQYYQDKLQEALYDCVSSLEIEPGDKKQQYKWNPTIEEEKRVLVAAPILIKDQVHSYLMIDESDNPLSEVDQIALEYTMTLVSLELLNKQAAEEKEQQIRGELLDDLLRKNYNDEEIIFRRGQFIHFDLSLSFVLFVIGIKDPEEPEGIPKEQKVCEEKKERMKEEVLDNLKRVSRQTQNSLIMLEKSSCIVCLASLKKGARDIPAGKHIILMAIKNTKNKMQDASIHVGVSRVYRHIDKIPSAYSEAELAERLGRKLDPMNSMTDFNDLEAFRFLYELKDSQTMLDFYHEHMDSLLEYDKQNSSELIRTLVSHFQNGGNLRKTAEDLNIHKNSVIYRIKKIETLIGKSLQDTEAAFNLQVCIKYMDVIRLL